MMLGNVQPYTRITLV